MAMVGMRFDLRVPPFGKATHAELYAACLEQCAWADGNGLDVRVAPEKAFALGERDRVRFDGFDLFE